MQRRKRTFSGFPPPDQVEGRLYAGMTKEKRRRKAMKKFFVVLAVCFLVAGVAYAADWEADINKQMADTSVTKPTGDEAKEIGGTRISVKDDGDDVVLRIEQIKLTPKSDTGGSKLMEAAKVKLASGILDAKNQAKKYFFVGDVQNGAIECRFPNYARKIGAPVIEHIWGIGISQEGKPGYLVLNPNDPCVSYETDGGTYKTKAGDQANLETLAVGLVMYPNKPTVSLKSLGKGKLVQGAHPELN